MLRFPYFGFPFQYPYYKYYNTEYYIKNSQKEMHKNAQSEVENNSKKEIKSEEYFKERTQKKAEEINSSAQTNTNTLESRSSSIRDNSFIPFAFNFNNLYNCDHPIIELFGIQLYLDDIIILCVLFLLYKENVKDEMLFITLILLLLS